MEVFYAWLSHDGSNKLKTYNLFAFKTLFFCHSSLVIRKRSYQVIMAKEGRF